MIEKTNASLTLGLELEGDLLKGIQLSYARGQPCFDKFFEIPVDFDHVNQLYTTEQGQDLQKSLQKALIITTLKTPEVLIRQLEIKLKKNKDIEEVLLFQTEPLLPYPVDNAVLDYIKIAATEEGTLLTVVVARKDYLQQHIEQWAKLQIEPEVVTAVPAALASFATTCVSAEHSYCIVHIGLESTTCVLLQQGKLIAAQAIALGVFHLKQALINETENPSSFGDIDVNELTEENHPALYRIWENMRLEIKRVIFSLSKQAKDTSIKELLITGTGALLPHLATKLTEDLDMQQIFPKQELFPSLTRGQIQNFAIPIGAALSGLPSTQDNINFRQGELVYPYPWKRLKNSLIIYGSLCLALAFAFYLFGQAYLSYRRDQIKESFVQLLTVMNKPYDSFEKEFETKNPDSRTAEREILGIQELNESDLFDRIQYLEKELQTTPDIFPLLPNVPKVSDVMAWLSTQHVLVGKKGKGEQPNTQPIQVESFSYDFVKRPEQNKKQDKYQVKVEIEFTSPTPKQAREFHDALIQPNNFVDPKGEVKWNSSHGRYRASFYLKDKTIYPTSA